MSIGSFGCADDGTSSDASIDSSSRDSGLRDGSRDSGVDTGPSDTGPRDTGPGDPDTSVPGTASRLTVLFLPGPTLGLSVTSEAGAPLLLTTSAAFDHDGTPAESVIASDGPGRRISGGVTETSVAFSESLPWVDQSGTTVTPDLLFAGALGAGPQLLIGTFGSDARVYDFATDTFGPVVALEQTDGTPFTPTSASTLNLASGTTIVALSAGSPNVFAFDSGTGRFNALTPPPETCSAGTAINADHVLGAVISGRTPPAGADSVVLIEGSNAFLLESVSPLCFSDALPLVDADGASLVPEHAYGFDYDGDGNDDVVMIDTVAVP